MSQRDPRTASQEASSCGSGLGELGQVPLWSWDSVPLSVKWEEPGPRATAEVRGAQRAWLGRLAPLRFLQLCCLLFHISVFTQVSCDEKAPWAKTSVRPLPLTL